MIVRLCVLELTVNHFNFYFYFYGPRVSGLIALRVPWQQALYCVRFLFIALFMFAGIA